MSTSTHGLPALVKTLKNPSSPRDGAALESDHWIAELIVFVENKPFLAPAWPIGGGGRGGHDPSVALARGGGWTQNSSKGSGDELKTLQVDQGSGTFSTEGCKYKAKKAKSFNSELYYGNCLVNCNLVTYTPPTTCTRNLCLCCCKHYEIFHLQTGGVVSF